MISSGRSEERLEALEAEVLRLAAGGRARLIERLIAGLDVDQEIEEAWAGEVERRQTQIDTAERFPYFRP